MRVLSLFVQVPLLLCALLLPSFQNNFALAAAPVPIANVQVTLKGKKYAVEDVTTVEELQERLQEQSGIAPSQQGRILFQGSSLSKGGPSLSEAGVSEGSMLNCVPSSGKSKKKSSSKTSTKSTTTTTSSAAAATPAASTPAATDDLGMKEMLKASGVDTKGMEDMVNQMMGGSGAAAGGGEDGMPSMAESMSSMAEMMKSPIFSEYMNDPEKLEQSRQMILQNPMLKSMMGSMPGMEELLNDPEAWAAAMKQASEMYSSMDQNDLMQAMMQGADARMNDPTSGAGGLFGDQQQQPTALDELSEGEE